ncbi:TolC family protein [Phycisphaera mikurensis]|uniref:Putative efflux system outer membrane protein n=1 Tax=Phycisphaera mikurensis (strain NBRC 102666 / KCTC 22515 / FYK2301M01) TaxID=1142394 RepID=I0IJG6_PHYMF|nr:TolC family protein [Phycisphaera mikurensis]MBB6443154.1 outer membrane protein TolC [Phycisphaera mikurensis]BAM05404.1 putative efflux system outer membrane protein [Phycisphaera mikurensis NBRC 102666]
MKQLLFTTTALALAASACTSAPRDAGFGDVADTAKTRGGVSPAWTRTPDADREADRIVRETLAQPLTAEAVVRVAILHNRDLQAVYEELGISRGQLIQAGLPDNPVFVWDTWFFNAGTSFEGALFQNLISVFTIPLRREIQGEQFEAAKRRVAAAVLATIGDARRAYVTFLTQRQLVDMERAVVTATEASYLTAERLRQAGNVPQLTVLRERALYEESKLQLNVALEQLAAAREALNQVMSLSGSMTTWTVPAGWSPVGPPAATVAAGEARPGVTGLEPGDTTVLELDKVAKVPGPTPTPMADTPLDAARKLAGPPRADNLSTPPGSGTADAASPAPDPAMPDLSWLGALSEPGGAGLPDPLVPSQERSEAVERRIVERSLVLSGQRHLIEAQATRLKLRNILALFPFLNVGITTEKGAGSSEFGLGPSVATPIPVFDLGQGIRPEEASRLRQRLETFLSTATSLRSLARTAEVRLQTTRERAAYLRDVVLPLHASLVAESQLQYNAMALTPFDLLLAKRQQIAAGRAYLLTLRAYWLAYADLQQLLDGSVPPMPGAPGLFVGPVLAPMPTVPAMGMN